MVRRLTGSMKVLLLPPPSRGIELILECESSTIKLITGAGAPSKTKAKANETKQNKKDKQTKKTNKQNNRMNVK